MCALMPSLASTRPVSRRSPRPKSSADGVLGDVRGGTFRGQLAARVAVDWLGVVLRAEAQGLRPVGQLVDDGAALELGDLDEGDPAAAAEIGVGEPGAAASNRRSVIVKRRHSS